MKNKILNIAKMLLAFWAGGATVAGTMALAQFPDTGHLLILEVVTWPYFVFQVLASLA